MVALLPASICARRTSAKTAKRCSSVNTTACGVLAGSVQEISAHIENRERSAGSARPRMPCVCCAPRLWLVGRGPDLVCLCPQRPQWPLCASVVYSQFFSMRLCLFIFVFVCLKITGRDKVLCQHTAAEVWHCPEAGDDDRALTDAKAASAPATSSSPVAPTHHRTTFPPFPSGPGPKEPPTYRQDWSCLLYTSPSPRDRG